MLYNGSVYIGVSSIANCPSVQAKLYRLDAATGAVQNTFKIVPDGCTGGSLWGTPTIDAATGTVYFGTGNDGNCGTDEPFATAIVAVHASDLSLIASWKPPPADRLDDTDFGASTLLFSATVNGTVRQLLVRCLPSAPCSFPQLQQLRPTRYGSPLPASQPTGSDSPMRFALRARRSARRWPGHNGAGETTRLNG